MPDDTCDVVVIDTDNGPVRINASDFDPAKHKLHKETKAEAAAAADAPAPAAGDGTPSIPPGASMAPAPSAVAIGPAAAQAPTTPSPDTKYFTMPQGTGAKAKTIVVGTDGKPVKDHPCIDPAGYGTPEDAVKAIHAAITFDNGGTPPAGSMVNAKPAT